MMFRSRKCLRPLQPTDDLDSGRGGFLRVPSRAGHEEENFSLIKLKKTEREGPEGHDLD